MLTNASLSPLCPSSPSSCSDSDPITLTRYILAQQHLHAGATGDLSIVLSAIGVATKSITAAVRRAGLQGLYGLYGSTNVQGEEVKKLDIISDEIFCNTLRHTGRVALMITEEQEEPIVVSECPDAKYLVVFDPLDGSSNIDCNVSVGSIFAIYKRKPENVGKVAQVSEVLSSTGRDILVAGYAMFGSSTQLVIALGANSNVQVFTLDPTVGEFLLSHKDLRMPTSPQRIYSCNEGNEKAFPLFVQKFIAQAKGGPKPYSLRYVGSMVADAHRTLLYGGCFLYPSTAAAPSGKLRVLYECFPMALIMEAAGGKAVTSEGLPILDLVPAGPHARSTILMGSPRDIDLLATLRAEESTAAAAATTAAST